MSCCNSNIINLVSDDDKPDILFQIKDKTSGSPIDLSASTTTANFRFRQQGATSSLFDTSLSKVGTGETGQLKLTWPSTALDSRSEGFYEGEVRVSFNGSIHRVFDVVEFYIRSSFPAVS